VTGPIKRTVLTIGLAEVMPMPGPLNQLGQPVAVLGSGLVDQAIQAALWGSPRSSEVFPTALHPTLGSLGAGGGRIVAVGVAKAQGDAVLSRDAVVSSSGAGRRQLALLDPLQDGVRCDTAELGHFTRSEQRTHKLIHVIWIFCISSHKSTFGGIVRKNVDSVKNSSRSGRDPKTPILVDSSN
jgi:hypothetical protein